MEIPNPNAESKHEQSTAEQLDAIKQNMDIMAGQLEETATRLRQEDIGIPRKHFYTANEKLKQARWGRIQYQIGACNIVWDALQWMKEQSLASASSITLDETELFYVLANLQYNGSDEEIIGRFNSVFFQIQNAIGFIFGDLVSAMFHVTASNDPKHSLHVLMNLGIKNYNTVRERLVDFQETINVNVLNQITKEPHTHSDRIPSVPDEVKKSSLKFYELLRDGAISQVGGNKYRIAACLLVSEALNKCNEDQTDPQEIVNDPGLVLHTILQNCKDNPVTPEVVQREFAKVREAADYIFGNAVILTMRTNPNSATILRAEVHTTITSVELTMKRLSFFTDIFEFGTICELFQLDGENGIGNGIGYNLDELQYALAAYIIMIEAFDRILELPNVDWSESIVTSFCISDLFHTMVLTDPYEDWEGYHDEVEYLAHSLAMIIDNLFHGQVKIQFKFNRDAGVRDQPVVVIEMKEPRMVRYDFTKISKLVDMDAIDKVTDYWFFNNCTEDADDDDEDEDTVGLIGYGSGGFHTYPVYPIYLATDIIVDRIFQLFFHGAIDFAKNVTIDVTDIAQQFLGEKTIEDNKDNVIGFLRDVEKEYIERGYMGFTSLGIDLEKETPVSVEIEVITDDTKWKEIMGNYSAEQENEEAINMDQIRESQSDGQYPAIDKMFKWVAMYFLNMNRTDNIDITQDVRTGSFKFTILDEDEESDDAEETESPIKVTTKDDPFDGMALDIAYLIQDRMNHCNSVKNFLSIKGQADLVISEIAAMIYPKWYPSCKSCGEWFVQTFGETPDQEKINAFIRRISTYLTDLDQRVEKVTNVNEGNPNSGMDIIVRVHAKKWGETVIEESNPVPGSVDALLTLAEKVAELIQKKLKNSYQDELRRQDGSKITMKIDGFIKQIYQECYPDAAYYEEWFTGTLGEDHKFNTARFMDHINVSLTNQHPENHIEYVTSEGDATPDDFTVIIGVTYDEEFQEELNDAVRDISYKLHCEFIKSFTEKHGENLFGSQYNYLIDEMFHQYIQFVFNAHNHGRIMMWEFLKRVTDRIIASDDRIESIAFEGPNWYQVVVRFFTEEAYAKVLEQKQVKIQTNSIYGCIGETDSHVNIEAMAADILKLVCNDIALRENPNTLPPVKLPSHDVGETAHVVNITDLVHKYFPDVPVKEIPAVLGKVEKKMKEHETIISNIKLLQIDTDVIYAEVTAKDVDIHAVSQDILKTRKEIKKEMDQKTMYQKMESLVRGIIGQIRSQIEVREMGIKKTKNIPAALQYRPIPSIASIGGGVLNVVPVNITGLMEENGFTFSREFSNKLRAMMMDLNNIQNVEMVRCHRGSAENPRAVSETWIYAEVKGLPDIPVYDQKEDDTMMGFHFVPHEDESTTPTTPTGPADDMDRIHRLEKLVEDLQRQVKKHDEWLDNRNLRYSDLLGRVNRLHGRVTNMECKTSKKTLRKKIRKEVQKQMKNM